MMQARDMTTSLGKPAIASALALAVGSQVALAADMLLAPVATEQAAPGWIATVGATALLSPRYEGSTKYGVLPFPSLSFRRAGEPLGFSVPDDSPDYALYSSPAFRFGPVAALRS